MHGMEHALGDEIDDGGRLHAMAGTLRITETPLVGEIACIPDS